MQVLMLSLDKGILETDSAVQRRLVALAEKTGEITVLVPGERDEKRLVSEHLTVYSFGGAKIMQLWKMWRTGKRLLAFHLSLLTRVDLITVQDPYFLGLMGYFLSRRFAVPLEIQVHGFEKLRGLRAHLAKFVLLRAHMVRVVSERLKRELDLRFTIYDLGRKIYVLPIYTQISTPPGAFKRKTVPYPFTFLTVGRLVPVKNIAMQIRALAKVAEKIPHVRLRVVGDGPLLESLKLEVKSLKLEDKAIFEGYQKDLERYYEEADAFLLTSDSEGWGRVVLEAAAHKLPIIMTDVGLAREVIKNEENGLIIPIQDEDELARAMQEFLDKPELRACFGEAAFKTFKSLPSREAYIEKQIIAWKRVSSPAANIERTA